MSNCALRRGTAIYGPFCTLVHCDSHPVSYPTSDVYTETFRSPCIALALPELQDTVNPLNAELNPICHLLALLGAHLIFHVSGLRVNVFMLCVYLTTLPVAQVIQCRK